jgi:hypothetical protein
MKMLDPNSPPILLIYVLLIQKKANIGKKRVEKAIGSD